MSEQRSVRGFFQALVSDQLIGRVVEFSVGALVGGPLGAVAVPVVGKALEYYGVPVAGNLVRWVRGQPAAEACVAMEAVANLSPAKALKLAEAAVEQAAPPGTPPEKLRDIKNYLAGIPAAFRQSLPRAEGGKTTVPAALLPQSERQALGLLPTHLPPYNAPCDLPGTPYRLVRLLGTGGFGAVYEAVNKYEHEPRAIKFCLDAERTSSLKREKAGFGRLMSRAKAGGWPAGVVRYHGEDLDHATPFLIFELVPDGDLMQHAQNRRAKAGRAMSPDEVLALMRELAAAAGHLHAAGVTHRDLKPSNVLFAGSAVRIADLGLGAVVPQAGVLTRQRSVSETMQESRGGGTALYMAPEQGRGADPHPTQDVYSLGVIWYQLLIEDFGRAPGPSWRRTLQARKVPAAHLDVLERCLDEEAAKRPKDGSALVAELAPAGGKAGEAGKSEEESPFPDWVGPVAVAILFGAFGALGGTIWWIIAAGDAATCIIYGGLCGAALGLVLGISAVAGGAK